MKFIFAKQFCYLFSVIFCVLLLSGCATASLWGHDQSIVVLANNPAKVDQIYAAVEKKTAPNSSDYVNIVRYAIPYHLMESDRTRSNKTYFPEKPHGYLIISDNADFAYNGGTYYGEQYQDTSKYRELFQSTQELIKELNANRFYVIKVYGLYESIKLDFRFKKYPNTKPALGYLDRGNQFLPPGFWFGLDTLERPNDENKPGYYNLCCLKGTVTYADKIDFTEFTPILPEEFGPLETKFYLLRGEKKYRTPLSGRLIGTPFTVAVDIITFPLQLIYFSILPHGPGWPWLVE